MNVTKRLDVELEQDEYELLADAKPIRIPTSSRVIVVYPPQDTNQETMEVDA
jgi:hypothetical protein